MINDRLAHVFIFRKQYYTFDVSQLPFQVQYTRNWDEFERAKETLFLREIEPSAKSFDFHWVKIGETHLLRHDDSFFFSWATFEVKKSRKQLDRWQVNLGLTIKRFRFKEFLGLASLRFLR